MLTTPRIKDMAEEQAGRVEEPENGEESCDPCTPRHQNPSMERAQIISRSSYLILRSYGNGLLLGRESHFLLRI